MLNVQTSQLDPHRTDAEKATLSAYIVTIMYIQRVSKQAASVDPSVKNSSWELHIGTCQLKAAIFPGLNSGVLKGL